MITEFKVGKTYRYTKESFIKDNYYPSDMEKVLDKKPRKCLEISIFSNNYAKLEGLEAGWYWYQENLEYFQEYDIYLLLSNIYKEITKG